MKTLIAALIASLFPHARTASTDDTDRRDRIDSEGCVWAWGCPCTPWLAPVRARAAWAQSRRDRGVSCNHLGLPAGGHGWWCLDDLHAGPEDTLAAVSKVTGREVFLRTSLTEFLFR